MKDFNFISSFSSESEPKFFKKGAVLLKAGEFSNFIFYVKKGLLRSYSIDKKGKEHVFLFAAEGWIITDIESQEFNKTSELYIDCIEDSEIIAFDEKLFKSKNLKHTQFGELLMKRVAVLQQRVMMLMSASATERYNAFLKTYPKLPNRVPQHMIASYLGITPQALSNIRKKNTI